MAILRQVFEARPEWWLLVPDQLPFASGDRTEGKVLRLAARHQKGKWALVYLASKATFSIDFGKLAGAKVQSFWVDPRTGKGVPIRSSSNRGVESFSTPDGWEDALLILEAVDAGTGTAKDSGLYSSCLLTE
jgi:hypothetical protein